MSTRNFDASRITKKMQDRTLYGYYNNNDKNNGNNVRPEQGGYSTNATLLDRQQGACSCSYSTNSNTLGLMAYNTPGLSFQNPVTFNPKNNF